MPEGIFLSRIEGTRAELWIPSLSILVVRSERPTLTRRHGDNTPTVGQFDLHAVYSFLNENLFHDEDFAKEWTFWLGKKPMRLTLLEGSKIDLVTAARTLRIEGVDAQWLSQSASAT